MEYTKQNFVSGQVLKAEHMNHIENGIDQNTKAINTMDYNLSNKADVSHTHDNYLTSVPNDYKTKTENDTLYQPIGNYAAQDDIPTKTSQLTNDSGFINELPTIPTKTSQLTNDSGFVTENQMENGGISELTSPVIIWNLEYGLYRIPKDCVIHYNGTNVAVRTTASSNGYLFVYGDSSANVKHFIMFRGARINNASDYSQGEVYITAGWSSASGGYYNDIKLNSKLATETYVTNAIAKLPTQDDIPTNISDLTNDSAFVNETYVKNAIAEAELSGGDVDLSGYATKNELPTKTSQLTNDSGFITADGQYITKISGNVKIDNLDQGIYVSDSDTTALYCGNTADQNGYVRKGSIVVVTWVSTTQRSVCVIGYQGGFYRMMCYTNTGAIVNDYFITQSEIDEGYLAASADKFGMIKVGDNLNIDNGVLSAVIESPLKGKKITVIGDSLSTGYTVGTNWVNMLAERTGAVTVNLATDGATIAMRDGDNGNNFPSKMQHIPTDSDYIVIMGGGNDMMQSTPLGSKSERNNLKTVSGAIFQMIAQIETYMPTTKLMFITEPPIGSSIHEADLPYKNMILEMCAFGHIPCFDMTSNFGLNPTVPQVREIYWLEDCVHLTETGQEYMSHKIQKFLENEIVNNSPSTGGSSDDTTWNGYKIEVVDELPETEEEGVMYFVRRNDEFNLIPIFEAKSSDESGATWMTDGTDRCMTVNGTPTGSSNRHTNDFEMPLVAGNYYMFNLELVGGSVDPSGHDDEIGDFILIGRTADGADAGVIIEKTFNGSDGAKDIGSFVLDTTYPFYRIRWRVKSNTIYENTKIKVTIKEV